VTRPPGSKAPAFLASGALLAGLLAGLTTPASSAATSTPTHRAAVTRVLHGPDVVYRHRSIRVPRSFFGLHDGSELAYNHLDFGALRLWDAGVRWSQIETSPGVYDWSHLDSLVSAAQAHHVQVTLVLAMTPTFYAESQTLPPTDLSHYEDYVRAVMERYRDFNGKRGISSYQVWNEGNIRNFWTGTPQQLAELTAIVDRVRDQVDPAATVVAPSFAIRLPYQRAWLSAYQSQTVNGRPVWRYYNVNALSIYPKPRYGSRLGGPEDAMMLVSWAKHRMVKAGVPRWKPLWATEINYGVNGGNTAVGPAERISERRQVANVLRTYLLGAAKGLTRVFWYRYDWWRLPDGGTLGNTLLSDPDNYTTLTPGGRALKIAERWMRGRLVSTGPHRHPCARDRVGTYSCTVRFDGHFKTILWNPLRHVRIRVPARAARSARTVTTGRSAVVQRGTRVIRVGFQPVVLRFAR